MFKGDELYGMMLSPEKAAVVASWLNWAAMVGSADRSLEGLSDGQLRLLSYAVRRELELRGVEAARGQAEGGAEGDPVAVAAVERQHVGDVVGSGDGGDRAAGRDGGVP